MALITVVTVDSASRQALQAVFPDDVAPGVASVGERVAVFSGDAAFVTTLRAEPGVLVAVSHEDLALAGAALDFLPDALDIGSELGLLLGIDPTLVDELVLEDLAGWLYWCSPSFQASLIGRLGDGDSWDFAGACLQEG